MKSDGYWSSILVCPVTGSRVSAHAHAYNNGVCPSCGHLEKATFTHCQHRVGYWERPSLVEWMAGKRKIFHEHRLTSPQPRA
jgi:hypothetical protein